jgi:hypothetical protein
MENPRMSGVAKVAELILRFLRITPRGKRGIDRLTNQAPVNAWNCLVERLDELLLRRLHMTLTRRSLTS